MDPNKTLDQIRALYQKQYPTEEDTVQLAELIEDLDDHLHGGGFLPLAWEKPMKDKCNAKHDIFTCDRDEHSDSGHIDPNGRIWTSWYPTGAVLDAPEGHSKSSRTKE